MRLANAGSATWATGVAADASSREIRAARSSAAFGSPAMGAGRPVRSWRTDNRPVPTSTPSVRATPVAPVAKANAHGDPLRLGGIVSAAGAAAARTGGTSLREVSGGIGDRLSRSDPVAPTPAPTPGAAAGCAAGCGSLAAGSPGCGGACIGSLATSVALRSMVGAGRFWSCCPGGPEGRSSVVISCPLLPIRPDGTAYIKSSRRESRNPGPSLRRHKFEQVGLARPSRHQNLGRPGRHQRRRHLPRQAIVHRRQRRIAEVGRGGKVNHRTSA